MTFWPAPRRKLSRLQVESEGFPSWLTSARIVRLQPHSGRKLGLSSTWGDLTDPSSPSSPRLFTNCLNDLLALEAQLLA